MLTPTIVLSRGNRRELLTPLERSSSQIEIDGHDSAVHQETVIANGNRMG
jgi:hypothetical protein